MEDFRLMVAVVRQVLDRRVGRDCASRSAHGVVQPHFVYHRERGLGELW